MPRHLLRWGLLGLLVPAGWVVAQDQPLPPSEAAARMTLPEGFRAVLFAAEPDLVQPIAFTVDDRGRVWVVESHSYPNWIRDGKPGRDRILIFEDTDGDGRFDTRKVFADNLANVSGIALGFGGVWLCAAPNFQFVPDRDGDDRPDGPPRVLIDGWSLNAKHNVASSLTWGPDGWLYGCNGITDTSRLGPPGTPADQRIPFNCGVWHHHPTRHRFEIVAWGTTNPWGLDFDEHGQMFITNCVIAHLWHVVYGAHFQRMFGQDLNPHTYGLLATCADHLHWAGGPWQSSRGGSGPHGESGGGHAHVGCLIYQGDNWPERYRNGVFMCNLHGNRVNHDILERKGSGYVARHGRDFLHANDPWFRGLALHAAPDGGVYLSDWCDSGECHDYDQVHVSGRIFKITYGSPKHSPVDLPKWADSALVQLQLHRNEWFVRHGRRLLQERAALGQLAAGTRQRLRRLLAEERDVPRRLRVLWALHAVGATDELLLLSLLSDSSEYVRAWAIQLGLEALPSPAFRQKLVERAENDPSRLVRLYLASGLQRLPLAERWPLAARLASHAEDADDPNLPLMIWYGIEPLPRNDLERAVQLVREARMPLVREYLARRIAALPAAGNEPQPGLAPLLGLLREADDPVRHRDLLRGMQEAYRGQRQPAMPPSWPATYRLLAGSPCPEVRERAVALAVLFGDPQALGTLRQIVLDGNSPAAGRRGALEVLLGRQQPELVPLLHGLLADPVLRGQAIRGLAAFPDPQTPALLLKAYADFSDDEKGDAIHTLASRPAFALALLDAVEKNQVPRRDLSAFTVRQMLGLGSKQVAERLEKVWGTIRPASAQKAELLAKYRSFLTADFLKRADRANGRALYVKHCAACHRLFDDGGDIGPDLTGSQRTNLDYLLENLLDPSALVPGEYQMTLIATKNGRVINGIIQREDGKSITVQTQNEQIVLPKEEIEERQKLPLSLMPEGQLEKLSREDVRDLIAYLSGPSQVPLPQAKRGK
jgi:putative membrane-bound dehydrogenase-like protein